jgi:hypothetical protein
VRCFLVETYLETRSASELEAVVGRARAIEIPRAIRHLGSLALLEDEVCFHVFEAPSARALLAATQAAGLSCERVTETLWRPGRDA